MAHTLAGSSSGLGARQMRALALALELAAMAGDWSEVSVRLPALQQAWSDYQTAWTQHAMVSP